MRRWSASFLGALSSIILLSACAGDETGGGGGGGGEGGESGGESSCEKLCRRGGEIDCADADCVSQCAQQLPKCDGEYRTLVDCMANAELLGCDPNTHKVSAADACASQNGAFGTCLLGGGGAGGGAGGGGGSGNTGPCDPVKASCVGCGTETCGGTEACCWDATPACGSAGSCSGGISSTCDGAEDCPGASCCVSFLTTMDGSASSGEAKCSAGGGSLCCSASPGTPGCAADKTVEMCVCAQDAFCCSMEWDAMCVGEVEQFGCAMCSAGCDFSNGSTGTGSSIHSVACRSKTDCAGVTGEFGVPYSECCRATNFGVGACVSQTFQGAITDSGGSCN